MKIIIELEDPKSCKGCPCLERNLNQALDGVNVQYPFVYKCKIFIDWVRFNKARPQTCLDKQGE